MLKTLQILVPDDVLDEAKATWAPPGDPIFALVPPGDHDHIATAYTSIGSPAIHFDSFWDVYNALRDAVEDNLLSGPAAVDRENRGAEDQELPLSHLQACTFGRNKIPNLREYNGIDGSKYLFLNTSYN
jgi:hypothetical protein